MIEFTQEERERLEAAEKIVPTNTPCVLVRKDLFERIQGLLADEDWTKDAYRAALAVFARDGWDDPWMNVYNDLDPRRSS